MSLVAYAALLATSQVAIDGDGRVLDASERPIPGLYAAGRVTGGLDGGRPSATSKACWSPEIRMFLENIIWMAAMCCLIVAAEPECCSM
jgi:hypothetical protein